MAAHGKHHESHEKHVEVYVNSTDDKVEAQLKQVDESLSKQADEVSETLSKNTWNHSQYQRSEWKNLAVAVITNFIFFAGALDVFY